MMNMAIMVLLLLGGLGARFYEQYPALLMRRVALHACAPFRKQKTETLCCLSHVQTE